MTDRRKSTFPSFLGIGAQRAGTGWLYRNLLKHPGIWMTPVKELHYFDSLNLDHSLRARLKSKAWYRSFAARIVRDSLPGGRGSPLWDLRYFLGTRSDEWYASLFPQAGRRAIGEITPSYSILDREVVASIKRLMPAVRVIFFMRDPVDRVWSHAINDLVGRGKRRFQDIPETDFIAHINKTGSELRTDYLRTVQIWEECFPPEQIFFGFYDDIIVHPERTIDAICGFLDIEPMPGSKATSLGSRVKPSMGGRYKMPEAVRRHAVRKYLSLTESLSLRFGGHADNWLSSSRASLGETSLP